MKTCVTSYNQCKTEKIGSINKTSTINSAVLFSECKAFIIHVLYYYDLLLLL